MLVILLKIYYFVAEIMVFQMVLLFSQNMQ